jgi:DNA polymerase V
MKIKLFALIDCSSFYCSCERVFRPELKDQSICVLSNNDGCVISLTPEVKSLGIRIGTPFFKIRDMLVKNKVAVFSSNYCLYADMSRRVMQTIKKFSDTVEVYSIDEAFIELIAETQDIENERIRLQKLAEDIHHTVMRATGIPVRVSIAETKTLAKVGSDVTKKLLKEKKIPAVCFWNHPDKLQSMKTTPIEDVWGIGKGFGDKLKSMDIHTAYNLAEADARMIGKKYTIVLQKTVLELQGVVCNPIESGHAQRKSLIRSRSFGHKLNDSKLILQALSTHVARGAEKLRQEKLVTGALTVEISTGQHSENILCGTASIELSKPTNDTLVLSKIVSDLFKKCYVQKNHKGEPYQYIKAGVIFHDLKKDDITTHSFFDFINTEKNEIMYTLDKINKKFGNNALVLASQGTPDKLRGNSAANTKESTEWSMKRDHMSPRYTTVWGELMRVRIG